jgi:uncharacterized membrane protein YoaT (DUF817 family)
LEQRTRVEAIIDLSARRVLERLPAYGPSGSFVEFLVFGLKQGWACLFGGLLLGLILLTRLYWPEYLPLMRYDFLFLSALIIQVGMLVLRLEQFSEAKLILIFHAVGTLMEIFKTHAGSWSYPEQNFFRIGGVPLFSGFMYAAVGSYMARIHRIFDIRLEKYPSIGSTLLLAMAIYINFFTHHFLLDIRILLFAATILLFGRCTMHYRVFRFRHKMPLLLAFTLVALFIWIAENIGTWSKAWIYPNQASGWTLVSLNKFGAWYLLMIISVVLVTLVHRPRGLDAKDSLVSREDVTRHARKTSTG